MNELKKRSSVDERFKWSIEDLYKSDESWEKEFNTYTEKINEITQYKNRLTIDNLAECLALKDKIFEQVERLYVYANLKGNEDSTNTKYQGYCIKADALISHASNASAFIEPEILALDEDKLLAKLNSDSLNVYTHYIKDILRSKKHILDSDKESLLAQFYEINSAPENIFGMLNNADISFPDVTDSKGEAHKLTHGTFISLLQSSDRILRKNAFKALYETYYKQKNTISTIYTASVKKDIINAKIRNYNTALDSCLFANNIPTEVYTNLISTVKKHLPLMHKYVALRKKCLKLDELNMYDLYTPIVEKAETYIDYTTAKKTVLKSVAPLGKEYVDILSKALNEEKWVDIYENEGKRSGAYSWGSYGCHPFVSLNFNNNVDSMFTLAHEMGHAMHSHYTWSNQPFIYGDYTIFVAEVASTVNEALLMEYLLANTTDKNQKMYLLNYYMEQFRGTLFRQTMFAEFELKIHTLIENGDSVTFTELCEIYMELNREYYGSEITIDNEISWEWARIPHFYTQYYVYQYATGYSAAIALSQKILKDNGAQAYINFLKSGSSKYSIDLLKGAGVDMTTAEPINNAMKVFESVLTQIENLIK